MIEAETEHRRDDDWAAVNGTRRRTLERRVVRRNHLDAHEAVALAPGGGAPAFAALADVDLRVGGYVLHWPRVGAWRRAHDGVVGSHGGLGRGDAGGEAKTAGEGEANHEQSFPAEAEACVNLG